MAKKPIPRAPIRERLWATGRPSSTNEIADIYVACIRSGMNDAQAFAVSCLAHDTAKGFEWNIEGAAQMVQLATRQRHAADHPEGCWATLVARYGLSALRFPTDDPRIINWVEPKEPVTPEVAPPAPQTRAFNTGRGYTEHGQRIAWTLLSTGNVAMLDMDRHIEYILAFAIPPRGNSDILDAYDNNRTAPWNQAESDEARTAHSTLQSAAESAPSKAAEHAAEVARNANR